MIVDPQTHHFGFNPDLSKRLLDLRRNLGDVACNETDCEGPEVRMIVERVGQLVEPLGIAARTGVDHGSGVRAALSPLVAELLLKLFRQVLQSNYRRAPPCV